MALGTHVQKVKTYWSHFWENEPVTITFTVATKYWWHPIYGWYHKITSLVRKVEQFKWYRIDKYSLRISTITVTSSLDVQNIKQHLVAMASAIKKILDKLLHFENTLTHHDTDLKDRNPKLFMWYSGSWSHTIIPRWVTKASAPQKVSSRQNPHRSTDSMIPIYSRLYLSIPLTSLGNKWGGV